MQQWELARDAGNAAGAPRPVLPEPGQAVVVTVPCYICTTPLPYQSMRILRACPECARAIIGASAPTTTDNRTDEERRRDANAG